MPKGIKWEVIAHEYVVSLFPVFMLVDGIFVGIKKHLGVAVEMAEVITGNTTTHCYQLKTWDQAHRALVARIKGKPEILKKFFLAMVRDGKRQVAYTKKVFRLNLAKTSNRQLNNYYQKYCSLNTDFYAVGLILPLLDFQKTTFLSDEVSKILKHRRAINYFSLLTTPLTDSFNKIQELNLLSILVDIKKKKKVFGLFKEYSSREIVDLLPKLDKDSWQKIRRHAKKYAWVHYVYQGPAGDEAYFIDFIRDFIRRKIDPKKEILNHRQAKEVLARRQNELYQKLKLTRYEKQILLLARDAVYYKIYRRDMQSASYYYLEPLLLEIGRRLGLSIRQVRMMLPEEIAAGLIDNKVDYDEINSRLKFLVYYRLGKTRKILSGVKAKEFSKNVKIEKVNKNISEFTGATAQTGKAKGRVKIINSPEEMTKMSKGDILVSGATNPNLMPAIRQASAIVTDEGGLTCHAAIVSRELKIPCVVGTNFATKVLKDGDTVEVDAKSGLVKKI
ncbi:MAG: PEP-utilizing enzyme [Patescibacteria group bacterium]|jgi:phosphohistidine swiveling domain-containing protein|nr:PEP-utilizing enzyme [Patescibacteria group bacterium]